METKEATLYPSKGIYDLDMLLARERQDREIERISKFFKREHPSGGKILISSTPCGCDNSKFIKQFFKP